MSMLATANPSPHPPFGAPPPWEVTRCPDYSLRPRTENDRVALPSIRQAFPELQLQPQPQDPVARPPQSITPTPAPLSATSPKYVHSPNESKRRRLSIEHDQDFERARQIPRLYYGNERPSSRQVSPSLMQSQESWGAPSRSSPYPGNLSQPVPAPLEMKDRIDPRTSLPSLPPPRSLEREAAPVSRLPHSADVYRGSQPPMPPHSAAPVPEPAPSYREPSYGYPYHHPNRYQSLSAGSVHAFDRTPFTAGGYPTAYPDYTGRSIFGDAGPGGMSGDNKQRKRRGNLPKETTDKLRAWFMAHLQHPYPTEDEKQELMRQTGLQMNQISNWFINARRRQLPTMINNARAESDAMTGVRGGEMKVLATTEHGDFDHHHKREPGVGPLSDGDGATYDEDLETLKQHRGANMSRGSV